MIYATSKPEFVARAEKIAELNIVRKVRSLSGCETRNAVATRR